MISRGLLWLLLSSVVGDGTPAVRRETDSPVSSSASRVPPRESDLFDAVQSILSERCYRCHGPHKQESGLRLDNPRDATLGGGSGPCCARAARRKRAHRSSCDRRRGVPYAPERGSSLGASNQLGSRMDLRGSSMEGGYDDAREQFRIEALVICAAHSSRVGNGGRDRVAAQPHRLLYSGPLGTRGIEAVAGSRSPYLDSPA